MAEGSIAVEAPPISSPVSAPESPQISIASDIEHLEHAVNNLKQAETAGPEIIPNTNLDAETKISIPDDNNITGKTQGEDASNKETDIQSSTEEPSVIPEAEMQVEKDLQNDPLYQKVLGKVTSETIASNKPLDGKELQEKALEKYQLEKAKESTEDKTEQSTVDKSLQEAEQRLSALLENNKENLESTMVTVSAADLAMLLKAAAETKEPDPKKKETKLALILKLLGVLVLSGAIETGKTVIPPTN